MSLNWIKELHQQARPCIEKKVPSIPVRRWVSATLMLLAQVKESEWKKPCFENYFRTACVERALVLAVSPTNRLYEYNTAQDLKGMLGARSEKIVRRNERRIYRPGGAGTRNLIPRIAWYAYRPQPAKCGVPPGVFLYSYSVPQFSIWIFDLCFLKYYSLLLMP